MTRLLACVLLLALATPVRAADPCLGFARLALTARVLAEEKLPQDAIVRVLDQLFEAPVELLDGMAALALADRRGATLFAHQMRQRCEAQLPKAAPSRMLRVM